MKPAGWIIMCISIGFVLSLATWCYRKVLTLPPLKEGEHL